MTDNEFNEKLYMVKGVFLQDETEPIVTGFYYVDKHNRHFIIGDDFGHYETNPYTICRCTGIKLKGSDYLPFEYDAFSYNEPMTKGIYFGYLEFHQYLKQWVLITSSETHQYRLLNNCNNLMFTGRNVLLNDDDMNWFIEYSKKEYEKSKGNAIDNSYCPSKFKR